MCSVPVENRSKSERLFFALWPGDALRQQIKIYSQSVSQSTAGRAVSNDNLHITLAFLGNVDVEQRRCIEVMADALNCSQFELCLERLDHWPRARVLCAVPAKIPAPLTELAAALHRGARECGLHMDTRAYRPHLTLKRKLAQAPLMLEFGPLWWRAESFVLLRSRSVLGGVCYELIRQWPLSAGE